MGRVDTTRGIWCHVERRPCRPGKGQAAYSMMGSSSAPLEEGSSLKSVLPVSLLDSGLPAAGSAHAGEVAVEGGAVDSELGGDLARGQLRVCEHRARHLHLVGIEGWWTTETRAA